MGERHLLTYPTWRKYIIASQTVDALSAQQRRAMLILLRSKGVDHDVLLPKLGMTAGALSMWIVLGIRGRGARSHPAPTTRPSERSSAQTERIIVDTAHSSA